MLYRIGDKVKVKSLDNLVSSNCDLIELRSKYCEQVLTIVDVYEGKYIVKENFLFWTDEMVLPFEVNFPT